MKKKKSARARLKWLTRCYAAGQTLLSRHQLFELILERTFFEKSAATGVEQHHRNDQHHIWMSKRKEKNVLCATLFPSANRQAYCCRSAQQNSEGVDDKKANAAVAHKQQITFLNFNILQARQKALQFFFSPKLNFLNHFMKMMSTFEQRGLAFFRMAFGGLMVVYSMRMIRYHHLALNQQSDGETWTIPHIP